MAKARVIFTNCLLDSQALRAENPNDDHLIARVVFDMEVGGRVYRGMYVDVLQPFGTDYATEPPEVGRPRGGYEGPFPHQAFSEAVDSYYRSFVGQGAAIDTGGHGQRTLSNNISICRSGPIEFDLPEASEASGGWQLSEDSARLESSGEQVSLVRVEGREFNGGSVSLDGYAFDRCTFRNCKIIYRGGSPTTMHDCEIFVDCDWILDGPALNTLIFLRGIYHGQGEMGMMMIDRFFQAIREERATGS